MAKPQLIAINEPVKTEGTRGKCTACGALLYSTTREDLNRLFAAHVQERHPGEDVNQAAARIVREAAQK